MAEERQAVARRDDKLLVARTLNDKATATTNPDNRTSSFFAHSH